MQRFKVPKGLSILFLMLLALTIGIGYQFSSDAPIIANTKEVTKKPVFSEEQLRLYHLQQHELQVAVNAYFEKAIANGDVVGAGLSIVKGDSIIISEGYGKRNINLEDRVDDQTVFRLGSLSKGFAGVLAANLKDEGKLNWEDRVSDYLPDFQLGDLINTQKITLANILSHTSGAPYHSFTNLVEAGLPLTDIAKHFKEVRPISNPGSLYSYQNALFALSEEIMYKATGKKINTSLEDRFFKPLEMCSTTMDYEALVQTENVALPHTPRRYGWRAKRLTKSYFNAIAAGGINASALDMARWMRFLLGHNPEVMSKSALAEAFNPFIEIKGRSKYYHRWPGHLSSYYAFGWRIHKFKEDDTKQEKTIWHHGGSVNNYRNEIAVFPEADLGICVLLNNQSKIAGTVIPDLYKVIRDVYKKHPSNIASAGNAASHSHLKKG
ncbi:serine hydrolase domain-containing protein [Muriicola sp. Z0-33]|uniref:serine hydrolase domain-containing protein n=1 Tax=Muriicola sp. Z0-33 TaxID=2816957 RepID=UPI00223745BB|nr:serine hydrolase domain-containing protein [Muriicola sp. Z0-33]MCW5515423.1 beta-lactamase family protein [Muriicola sp. Z0-33]